MFSIYRFFVFLFLFSAKDKTPNETKFEIHIEFLLSSSFQTRSYVQTQDAESSNMMVFLFLLTQQGHLALALVYTQERNGLTVKHI